MVTLGLPRLLGLPWEQSAEPGLRPSGLATFAVTGSPLTKQQGQNFTASWVVENTDKVTRYASLYVGVTNGAFLGGIGPVGVLPGSRVTLTTAAGEFLAPGAYQVDVVLAERTQADQPVREIARDIASVTIAFVGTLVAVGSPTIS